jgi:hypothetical protein
MSIPENIPPGRAAFAIITKPREAEIIQPYKKGVYHHSSKAGPSGSKRPRIEDPSESGNKSICTKIVNSMPDSKYLSRRDDLDRILKHLPSYVNEQYVTAAFAKSTWDRIKSALKCIEKFAIHTNTHIEWPMSKAFLHSFTHWALSTKDLSHCTVKAYLHDISLVHKLKNIDHSNFNDFLLTTTLKGAENLELYENLHKKGKPTITIQLLRNIGTEIAKSNLSKRDKQVFWASLTLAFWGSLRMGEVLAKKTNQLATETLTWNDIEIEDDSCLVHIKFPKVSKKGGDYVQIFKVNGVKCCPVRAMKLLKELSGKIDGNISPFKLSNGKFLTQSLFSANLKLWASPYRSKDFIDRLTGHCCRGAIPRILASRPDLADEDDISVWGRWSSEAFKIYAKKSKMSRKVIFDKIKDIVLTQKF